MSNDPILLMGGSGAIGRLTAQALRAVHPDQPLLIGGRTRAKAEAAAREIGQAEGVVVDPTSADLGLGRRSVGAVAVFYGDARLAGLRYAHRRGIPHLGISSGVFEIAPEIATFMHKPTSTAIVLGYEWLVGATTIATLGAAASFERVDDIAIGALVDEQDGGGPTVAEDFERLSRLQPAALALREGAWVWREGADAQATFHAIDGTEMTGSGFSSIDVAALAAETSARNVRFDLATGISSTRRRGEPKSTEIVIRVEGEDRDGNPMRKRQAVFHPGGAAPLTAIGVSMILERLTGLDGGPPTPSGLYFPYQVIDHAAYLSRLRGQGGDVIELDVV